jgi:monofunctional biosynthetic peptidoglycan transglycosylase
VPCKRHRWRRYGLIALLVVLIAPAAVILLYRMVPPPLTPLMVIRYGEGEAMTRDWVPLEAIAPALPRLVIAAEDNLFCRHMGFDREALKSQIETAQAGGEPRGASTISMQLAKNLFLWPDRSLLRKGLEFWLTLYVEALLPKRRIMELYLNIVEWGPGLYGAQAAARAHFGIDAAALSDEQASLMAAALPNPRVWIAGDAGAYVRDRAALYRRRVAQLGPDYFDCF